MAWDEQRRLRAVRSGDTARIEGLPVTGPADAAPAGTGKSGPPLGRGARAGRWGQRFGWMTAVAIAVVALAVALLAFSHAGSSTTAPARGRAPFGRAGGGFGGAYAPQGVPGYGGPH